MTTKLRNGMEYRWNESSAFQINQTVYLQTISIQEHKIITRDDWQKSIAERNKRIPLWLHGEEYHVDQVG